MMTDNFWVNKSFKNYKKEKRIKKAPAKNYLYLCWMFWEKWKACWESVCQRQFTASTRIQLVMFWPLCLLSVYTVSLAFQDRPNIICQWATWRYSLTVLSLLFSFDSWCYWGWVNILVVTERVCWQCLGQSKGLNSRTPWLWVQIPAMIRHTFRGLSTIS